jgi:NAD(P)H-nitrite reductase large subunit
VKYVIIGNGPAGVSAAATIRSIDKIGEITIISAEEYDIYSKCMLPDYLSGVISERQMFIKGQDFYEKKFIDLLRSHTVTEVDAQNKLVKAIDGSKKHVSIPYDRLLIASGSKQSLPPVPGLKESKMYFLGSLSDAKNLLTSVRKAEYVVVIGAGYVGLEVAFSLNRLGKKVTVVERLPVIVGGQLDDKASSVLKECIEADGVQLLLGTGVTGVTQLNRLTSKLFGAEKKQVITLSNNQDITADVIVVAAGSSPNLSFIKDSGIKSNSGIPVDSSMQTSQKDIYAAGDVVESIDAVTGNVTLSPIWPNAVIQGSIAGSNMAGIAKKFEPQISMKNASEFREVPLISLGMSSATGPEYEEYVDDRSSEGVYRKLVIKEDVVVGLIFLGDIYNAGVISALMKNKINIAKFKSNILSPSFGYSEVSKLVY